MTAIIRGRRVRLASLMFTLAVIDSAAGEEGRKSEDTISAPAITSVFPQFGTTATPEITLEGKGFEQRDAKLTVLYGPAVPAEKCHEPPIVRDDGIASCQVERPISVGARINFVAVAKSKDGKSMASDVSTASYMRVARPHTTCCQVTRSGAGFTRVKIEGTNLSIPGAVPPLVLIGEQPCDHVIAVGTAKLYCVSPVATCVPTDVHIRLPQTVDGAWGITEEEKQSSRPAPDNRAESGHSRPRSKARNGSPKGIPAPPGISRQAP